MIDGIDERIELWWHARITQLLIRLQKSLIHAASAFLMIGNTTLVLAKQLSPTIDRRCREMEWERDQKQVEIDRLRTELGVLHDKRPAP
jgi:hypothetical protein